MLTFSDLIKYIIEGLAVSIAAYLVAGQKSDIREILLLGLTAGITFMVLDLFTQGIGYGARQGAGFGIGIKQVGFLGNNLPIAPFLGEGFETEIDSVDSINSRQPNYCNMDMGVDSYGNTIGYDPEIQEYGRQPVTKKVTNYLGEVPYRFPNVYKSTCPQKPAPVPDTPNPIPLSPTCTKSRWMGWVEDGQPINKNTQDYKIVPGLYAKYIVQPGYREHIKTANTDAIDDLAPIIWPTNNPLDKPYFRERAIELREKKTMM